MIVSDILSKRLGEYQELSAKISPAEGKQDFRVWFRSPSSLNEPATFGDPFIAGLLLACMHENEDLYVDSPVSARLLENVEYIQEVFCRWYDFLKPIKVHAKEVLDEPQLSHLKRGTASCFSGGVDSWHTLLQNRDKITYLLLIRGFDIRIDNDSLWEESVARLCRSANTVGLPIITVTTNLRELADKRRSSWGERFNGDFWGQCLFASCIAAVGMSLQTNISKLYLPSAGWTYKDLIPHGSHPLVDTRWTTSDFEVIPYGWHTDRLGKSVEISSSDEALHNLRVCYSNPQNRYNCCKCEKCLRTMVPLYVLKRLNTARSFEDPLNIRLIKILKIKGHNRKYWQQLLAFAEECNEQNLANAIKVALGKRPSLSRYCHFARQFVTNILTRTMRGIFRRLPENLRLKIKCVILRKHVR